MHINGLLELYIKESILYIRVGFRGYRKVAARAIPMRIEVILATGQKGKYLYNQCQMSVHTFWQEI